MEVHVRGTLYFYYANCNESRSIKKTAWMLLGIC